MNRLPPRWLRRMLLAPVILVVSVGLVGVLPVALAVAWLLSPLLPSGDRAARVLTFSSTYAAVESVALIATFWLWVRAGFGRRRGADFEERHYQLLRRALTAIVAMAQRVLHVRFDVDDRDPSFDDDRHTRETRPVIVLSRHAGPGDSFLLVEELLVSGHRPRIVLKSVLQWEPLLDVVLNRLASSFVRGREETLAEIERLAADMTAGDALVLFPEGANFTEGRRQRSIAKLEELGDHERAQRARRMRYVLSPRAAGTLAALSAAPTADVIFVAHTGLEDMSRPIDLWRGLPMDAEVQVASWRVVAEDIPTTDAERRDWLDDWWHRIDRWIVDTRGAEAVPDVVLDALEERPS